MARVTTRVMYNVRCSYSANSQSVSKNVSKAVQLVNTRSA